MSIHQQKRDKLATKYANGQRLIVFGFILTVFIGLLLFVDSIINIIKKWKKKNKTLSLPIQTERLFL